MNTAAPSGRAKDLITLLDYYLFENAPFHIPEGGREWIVRFGPWITIVLLILTLPLLLVAFGIGPVFVPFGAIGYAPGFGLLTIAVVLEMGFMTAALPGLFARRMGGWRLLFYSQLVSIAFNLLSGSIVGGLLWGLTGLYVLFQVRMQYREEIARLP